jgi:homoserine kinase type II
MAVFTPINASELSAWLSNRPCGTLVSYAGIASGIENTNYFVHTQSSSDSTPCSYVLTIFEKLQAHELPFYLNLMAHLSKAGLPVPAPLADNTGQLFTTLKGKPATLVNRLPGESIQTPNVAQCAAMGGFLGQAHLAVATFASQQPNSRGLAWIANTVPQLKPYMAPHTWQLLASELAFQTQAQHSALHQHLPTGAIHADLFRDNALFCGDNLGGVFDFYFAGTDTLLFDLAVVANDWCIVHDTGALDLDRLQALLKAYQQHRPLLEAEQQAWPTLLRAAALRFWTSRLSDFYQPRQADLLQAKDPTHFERILKQRHTDAAWVQALVQQTKPKAN